VNGYWGIDLGDAPTEQFAGKRFAVEEFIESAGFRVETAGENVAITRSYCPKETGMD
jgi:hypothetical protein